MAVAERPWLDISVAFSDAIPPWPDDTPVSCGWSAEIVRGASVNLSKWTLSPHVGTHADAPLHVRTGGAGADQLPLAPFRGDAVLVDVSDLDGEISLEALRERGFAPGATRLLLRTGRTTANHVFPVAWPVLAVETARALVASGLLLLGVDAPSVDRRTSKSLDVHHALFDAGAFVLENLDLRATPPGSYDLLALPILTGAVDAAPARALLRPRG